MPELNNFSEASLLYADNYYLIERLANSYNDDIKRLFKNFEDIIKKKKWFNTKEWKIKPSGTYFEINYLTEKGKNPLYIWFRFRPYDVANKTLNGQEDKKRCFEIALSIRPEVSNGKEYMERFIKKAKANLEEGERQNIGKRTTDKTLIRRTIEHNLSDLLNVMEAEVDRFVKYAEYAKE